MTEDFSSVNSQQNKENEFDSFKYFALLYKNKFIILIVVVITAIASVLISLQLPNWYSSTLNAVPPQGTGSLLQGALGNISSALKDFGMTSVGGGSSSGEYTFMVIFQSRTIKDSIIRKYNLQEEYEMEDSKFSMVRKAFEANLDATSEEDGNFTITIWDKDANKAAEMVMDFFIMANNYYIELSNREAKDNRLFLEERLEQTKSMVIILADSMATYSKKYGLFAPEEQSKAISMALSDLKAELIKQKVTLELLKTKYGDTDPYTIMQKNIVKELSSQLKKAESKPGFVGKFALPNAVKIGFEYMRIYTELETFSKVKAFLLPMLEESRLNEVQSKQSLFVLDKPIPADRKSRPVRSLIVVGACIGMMVLTMIFIIGLHHFRGFRKRYLIYQADNDV